MSTSSVPIRSLVLAANARLPSQRAQSLQVVQAAASYARQGVDTLLLHARRASAPALPPGRDLFEYYAVPAGTRPSVEAAACVDWIDRFPRALQYLPARLQELSFARNAARAIRTAHAAAAVLSREAEIGARLARRGFPRLFLEIHRVPGGSARRRWLLEAARGARGVLAISGGVSADLAALGVDSSSIRVEHDAFEPARFAGVPDRAGARRELGLDPSAPLVVYAGGLLEWKGADLLVEAARELPAVRFAIAGGMEADVRSLRALAAGLPNVRIDGFQAPERVPLYLAAADLVAAPNRSSPPLSARYTSPLKVFEAMALGVPIVASDLPALRELLCDGVDAVLVAPDDARALAAGIARLLSDPELRRRISARLRERVAEHTWDARARRVLCWMEERLAESARS